MHSEIGSGKSGSLSPVKITFTFYWLRYGSSLDVKGFLF